MYSIKGTVSCDAETVRSQLLALEVEGLEPENAEQAESISAVRDAVADLIQAGVVGGQANQAQVGISGSVFPGHVGDSVSITVAQVDTSAETE